MIRRSTRQQKEEHTELRSFPMEESHNELDQKKDDTTAAVSPSRQAQKGRPKKDKTQRELDSVVLNLQEELQKAATTNSRPQRLRKITEKAEQEMRAKQSKAKIAAKKNENEKESQEAESLKPTGDKILGKSKEREHKDKIEKSSKDIHTKIQANLIEVEKKKKKNDKKIGKKNHHESNDEASCSEDNQNQIEIEDIPEEKITADYACYKEKTETNNLQTLEQEDHQKKELFQAQEQAQSDIDQPTDLEKIQLLEQQQQDGEDEMLSNSNSTRNKARKMPWSEEEDRLVIKLVEEHGPQKWTFIAQHIPGRIGKQCRERWHNHLNPRISKLSWCEDEEWLLFLCHRLKGNKWADITQFLIGRTDNAIKNHWNSSMKKRLPELISRYARIRRQEQVQYELAEEYKNIEEQLLTQLMQLPQHPDDQDSLILLYQASNGTNNNDPKNADNQNNTPKKHSKPKCKKQQKLEKNEKTSKSRNDKDSLKNIIESIPQEGEAFKTFRKQLLLCQDEFYAQQTPSAKITDETQIQAASGQNSVFDTPQAVRQMIQSNPAFADLVKTALKYSSDAKNLTSFQNMSCSSNKRSADRILLSATSTLLSAAPRGMDDAADEEIDRDEGERDTKDKTRNTSKDTRNGKDENTKKRGRKPKAIPSEPSKQDLAKKKIGAHPGQFMHPMLLMNLPHGQPHPFYHPHHGYLPPPPPHIMAQHMKGYSHQFPHGIPPPPPPFMRNGQMHYPHQLPIRPNGQGNGTIPPLQRLILPVLPSAAASGPARNLHQSQYVQNDDGNSSSSKNNNNSQDICSSEELQDIEANSSFQTPQKYQKNNLGERSAFKILTPQTDGASCGVNQSSKLPNHPVADSINKNIDKDLILKESIFGEELDEFGRQQLGSSFSKENINPNSIHLNNSKQTLNQTITTTTGLLPAHASSTSRFATPNKYETPSKLLDFGSEPRLNCSSVDNYFRYSSNHKSHHHHAGTLYASHANNFNHSSNSAFKCYPQLDFQDGGSSAKKQVFS